MEIKKCLLSQLRLNISFQNANSRWNASSQSPPGSEELCSYRQQTPRGCSRPAPPRALVRHDLKSLVIFYTRELSCTGLSHPAGGTWCPLAGPPCSGPCSVRDQEQLGQRLDWCGLLNSRNKQSGTPHSGSCIQSTMFNIFWQTYTPLSEPMNF